jgi:hypothetical protein
MSDDKYNIEDIVNFSAQEKPVSVKDAVNDVMLTKIHAEIEAKKLEVAKSIFGGTDTEIDEDDEDFDDDDFDDDEDEDDDFEISDEELDDLFNDLEELDDTDLEIEDEDGEDA